MKKQKPKKWGNRAQREAYVQELNAYDYKPKHTNLPLKVRTEYKFPRLRITHYAYAKIFERAGYPRVRLENFNYWKEVHEWLKDNVETYTWTGNIFWFENEVDKKRFEFKFHDYLLSEFNVIY